MRARLMVLLAAAVAAGLAMRKSIDAQRAERELWAEATDTVRPESAAR
ncbi:MAG: hypothetical protein IPN45_11475 [Actinomycetales bacterium]|nr:hypothetical protein [Actinomycetales bacterium]